MARETVGFLDVRSFGAFADGVNDDGRAIQKAVDAFRDFAGSRVNAVGLPAGTYLITTPVTVPNGITIQGTGDDTIIALPQMGPFSAFVVPVGASAQFRDVRFRGPLVAVGFIQAVEKQGATGTLQFLHVTAENPQNANVTVAAGSRFLQGECVEIAQDIEPSTGITLNHLGDALWVGGNWPRQIKGTIDPAVFPGVAAAPGSIFQRNNGIVYIKFGAADTDWAPISTPAISFPPVLGFGDGNIGSAPGTRFLGPWFGGANEVSSTTIIEVVMPRGGIVRRFFVRHNDTVGNGNSVVYTVMKNGVATAITATLATGAIGQASDLVNSFTVVQGDRLACRAVKAAAIGNGAVQAVTSMEFGG